MDLRQRLRALLGVSAYEPEHGYGPGLGSTEVDQVRRALGGNLAQQPTTKTRFYLEDIESAIYNADAGDLSQAAQLCMAMRRDGVIAGLLGSLTSGIIRLPKKFYGSPESIQALQARNGSRSVFDDLCPPNDLELLAEDGIKLGLGIAELLPVPGRDFPVLRRLEPELLRWRWIENRFYYSSLAGPIPIELGTGRFVLHAPGGYVGPWRSGLWPTLARSYIGKEHAMMNRASYSNKLANPARVAVSPLGANENQRRGFFQEVMAWGINSVFSLPAGWDVRLIESKGTGIEVFSEEIKTYDREVAIAICGNTMVVVDGRGEARVSEQAGWSP